MSIVDIAVIGSGAASTTTLIELFERLINSTDPSKKLKITVIDKYHEFWKGIPYGSRSSVNALTITAVSDFISTGKERELFFSWFKLNKDEIFNYYDVNGGLAAKKWLADNSLLIENEDWDKVYFPRFIWGIYMHKKLLTLLKEAEEKQLVQVTLIHAEVIDVDNFNNKLYTIKLEHPDKNTTNLTVKKLVVATGSPPVKKLVLSSNQSYTYINDLFESSVSYNLNLLTDVFANTKKAGDRNILLVGSNASCIELVYLLNNLPGLKKRINKIVAVSRTGSMPYHMDESPADNCNCYHLDKIKDKGNYNIDLLIKAAKNDIEQAVHNGIIKVSYVDRIIKYTIELMQNLDEEGKKIFFGKYGMQLTRLIRRSGPAYKNASEELTHAGKLQMLKGEFETIVAAPNGGLLKYTDMLTDQSKTFDLPFQIVINCTGSDHLANSDSRLISNLINKNICKVNLSGKGIEVNDKFEAAPNLYVIGPLLGGNMNKRIHFWHLENLARLLYLAPYLAACLVDSIYQQQMI